MRCSGRHGEWIDDRGVPFGRKRRDDFHVRIGPLVGCIDDTERRFLARQLMQRCAHILTGRDVVLDTPSHRPSFSSAVLPYLPAGTALTSPIAMRPLASAAARPSLVSATLSGPPTGATSTQTIAEQFEARVFLDQIARGDPVHPFEIGGGEHIGGCGLLKLACECGMTPRTRTAPASPFWR